MLALIVLWLLLAVGVGFYASTRGRSSLAWFVLALFVSPLVCSVILSVAPDVSSAEPAESSSSGVEETVAGELLRRLETSFDRGALTDRELARLRALAAREPPAPKPAAPTLREFTRPCPRCDRFVHPLATTCMHCWGKLEPAT